MKKTLFSDLLKSIKEAREITRRRMTMTKQEVTDHLDKRVIQTKQKKLRKIIEDNIVYKAEGYEKLLEAILSSGICDIKLPEKKELLPDHSMIHISDAGIISLQNHDIGFNQCLEIVKELNKTDEPVTIPEHQPKYPGGR